MKKNNKVSGVSEEFKIKQKQKHAEWDEYWSSLNTLEKTEQLGKLHETRHGVEEWENYNAFYSEDDWNVNESHIDSNSEILEDE